VKHKRYVLLALLLLAPSCGGTSLSLGATDVEALLKIGIIADSYGEMTLGVDPWEVVVCHIPIFTSDEIFEPTLERMTLSSSEIVKRLTPVESYFKRHSYGRYQPVFSAGLDVTISDTETSDDCVERALDQSGPEVRGVIVVADAEHGADEFGGWGTPGVGCTVSCSARKTRRSVYAGAGDFMDYWNGDSPLDLVEHEIGHALDWPHSTTSMSNSGQELYDSALDVMSDSSAPRMVISTKRHGPGILAINLYAARWFDDEHLQILDRSRRVNTKVQLLATDTDLSIMGTRFVVIVDGVNSFLTVELIAASGDNAHLKFDTVAIHRITVAGTSGVDRQQIVIDGDMQDGDEWTKDGLNVDVLSITSVDGQIKAEINIRSVERNSVID
jgi:hypothetical protein